MFQFFILAFLLSTTNAFILCPWYRVDVCVGISGDPLLGTPLQLKNRWTNLQLGTNRTEWSTVESKFLKIVWEEPKANSSKNATQTSLYMDKFTTGTRAVLSKRSDGAFINGSFVMLNGTDLCLTLMKCSPTNGFCDPYATQQVHSADDIRKGSYMRFRPCQEGSIAQTFEIDPPCARNCTLEKLENDKCDLSCNTKECSFDNGRCNTTTPTLMPTMTPTLPIPPSHSPTTHQPSADPTTSTSPPSLNPTEMPSQDTNHTFAPSSSEAPTPEAMSPSPSVAPSIQSTLLPSQSPTKLTLSPVASPSTIQPRTGSPVQPSGQATMIPTSSPSRYSNDDWAGSVIGFSLAISFLWVLVFVLAWLFYRRTKKTEDKVKVNEQRVDTLNQRVNVANTNDPLVSVPLPTRIPPCNVAIPTPRAPLDRRPPFPLPGTPLTSTNPFEANSTEEQKEATI